MREVERQLDRILTLLRNKIRQRGFTQLEVQEVLGWGRSYISQLLTKQKSLRVEQVLLILNVIGVDPAAFYAELYPPGGDRSTRSSFPPPGSMARDRSSPGLRGDFHSVQLLLRGLVDLLVSRKIVTPEEIQAAARESVPLPGSDDD